jgi:hypothetical protein
VKHSWNDTSRVKQKYFVMISSFDVPQRAAKCLLLTRTGHRWSMYHKITVVL